MANRCVLLFTGGRKSRLAANLLSRQKVEVLALHLRYPWCDDAEAESAAARLELPFAREEISRELWKAALSPALPAGKWSAPCGDCQALQLRRAAAFLARTRCDFIATGDAVGAQSCRPVESFEAADREAGVARRVLRPLSARLLPVTEPEEDGLVDRSRFLALSGARGAAFRQACARMSVDPTEPRGASCRFARRSTGERFAHYRSEVHERGRVEDLDLLAVGRHFLSGRCRIVVPATEEESEALLRIARNDDWLLSVEEVDGFRLLVRGKPSDEDLSRAAGLAVKAAGIRRRGEPLHLSAQRVGHSERRRIPAPARSSDAGLLRV